MKPIPTTLLLIAVAALAFGAGAYTTDDGERQTQPTTETSQEPPDGNETTWQTFNETFRLVVTKELPDETDIENDDNCVMLTSWLDDKPVEQTIRNGSVALSWSPNHELAESLHLGIVRSHDFHYREYSGRQLIVAPFGTDEKPMGYSFAFSVESTLEEFPYAQAVDMTLRFESLTEGEVTFNPKANCDIVPLVRAPGPPPAP